MARAELKIGNPYRAGFHNAPRVVDVTIYIPGYGGFTAVVPDTTSARELEKMRTEGEAEIRRVIETYSVTIKKNELVKEAA